MHNFATGFQRSKEKISVPYDYNDEIWKKNKPNCLDSDDPFLGKRRERSYLLQVCRMPQPVGRFVKIINVLRTYFHLSQVEVFGELEKLIPNFVDRKNVTLLSSGATRDEEIYRNLLKILDGNAIANFNFFQTCATISVTNSKALWIGVKFKNVYRILESTIVPMEETRKGFYLRTLNVK